MLTLFLWTPHLLWDLEIVKYTRFHWSKPGESSSTGHSSMEIVFPSTWLCLQLLHFKMHYTLNFIKFEHVLVFVLAQETSLEEFVIENVLKRCSTKVSRPSLIWNGAGVVTPFQLAGFLWLGVCFLLASLCLFVIRTFLFG